MQDTIVDKARFFSVDGGHSLKTFADTLFFYYLARRATQLARGDLIEIGVGGSTHVLQDVAQDHGTLTLIDNNTGNNIDQILARWPEQRQDTRVIPQDSETVRPEQLGTYCFAHIDGGKQYEVTRADMELMLATISEGGIICQDDYGNNKHPEVTRSVHEFVSSGQLRLLMVGDSSAYLVRPADHDKWRKALDSCAEFSVLRWMVSVHEAPGGYYYQNSMDLHATDVDLDEWRGYIKRVTIFKVQHGTHYLKMPYPDQSEFMRYRSQLICNCCRTNISSCNIHQLPTPSLGLKP